MSDTPTVDLSLLFGAKVHVFLPKKANEKTQEFDRGVTTHELTLMQQGVRKFVNSFKGEFHQTSWLKTQTGPALAFDVSLPEEQVSATRQALDKLEKPKISDKSDQKGPVVYWPPYMGLVKR